MDVVISPTGRELDFAYNGRELVRVTLRDPSSGAARVLITAGYRADGKLVALNVCGVQRNFGYGNGLDGRLQAIQIGNSGAMIQFGYDGGGILSREQPLAGPPFSIVTRFPDAKARHREREDAANQLPETQVVEDEAYRYHYAGNSVKLEEKKSGAAITYSNAAARGVETTTDAAGQETKNYYFRAPGQKYDGKLRRVEKGGVIVAEYRYSMDTGNLIESKDQDGVITFYQYPEPQPGVPFNPKLYSKPVRIYRGSRASARLIATMQYDSAGNLIQETDEKGKVARFGYDERGELISMADSTGQRMSITYDAFGRCTGITKGGTQGTTQEGTTYDDNGRVKSRRLPDGQTVDFTYDPEGRVIAVKQNCIMVAQYQRESTGEVIAQTDALGRTTRIDRDAMQRVLAVHQPNGSTTSYEYDQAGHRTAQIDGDGHRINFEYDAAGHLVKQTNALGQILAWTYSQDGRLMQKTNGVQTISYHYNDDGKLVLIDFGKVGEKIRYTYDEKGRFKTVATPTNRITLFYDSAGRVAARQLTRGQTSDRVIRYTYDDAGHFTCVVLSEKEHGAPDTSGPPAYRLLQQTEYAYDTGGRLTSLTSNGALVCTYSYDPAGRLIQRKFGNGIVGKYAYDTFGRQTRLDLTGGPLATPLSLVYQWDNAGQLTSRAWNGETQVYGYDPSGELTSVTALPPSAGENSSFYQPASNPAPAAQPKLLESYRYDAAGNMLQKYEEGQTTVMTYDAANQLKTATMGADLVDFTYDAAGRLVSETGPEAKTRQYGFLDKILVLAKADGTRLGYDYYPDGQLAAKGPLQTPTAAQPASGTSLLKQLAAMGAGDDDLAQSETQKSMGVTEEFVWEGLALFYRDRETFAIEPHPSGGVPIVSTNDPQNGMNTYYINDILGTTLAVVHPDHIEIVPLTAFGRPRPATQSSAPNAEPPKLSTGNGSL